MRLLLLFLTLTAAQACWFYSKQDTVDKIANIIDQPLTRTYVEKKIHQLSPAIQWTIEKLNVDIFEDCDANNDDTITMKELRETSTCLDSCLKLAAANAAVNF